MQVFALIEEWWFVILANYLDSASLPISLTSVLDCPPSFQCLFRWHYQEWIISSRIIWYNFRFQKLFRQINRTWQPRKQFVITLHSFEFFTLQEIRLNNHIRKRWINIFKCIINDNFPNQTVPQCTTNSTLPRIKTNCKAVSWWWLNYLLLLLLFSWFLSQQILCLTQKLHEWSFYSFI